MLMKSFKTALIMLLLLFSVTVALKAAEDFDILDMLPAITGKVKCNFSGLEKTFKTYAVTAAAMVDPADKALVADYVSKYPEGGDPPTLTDNSQGGYDQNIPSRAAAFYLTGVQAVIQQNRVVAFWCFTEAASRNAHSPIFLNNAAFALIEFGYLDDALKALQCANSLAPDFVSPYINLGKVLVLLGRCAEAAKHYNTGFLKFPNNPHYLWRTANAYKCAVNLSQAWGLGNLGKLMFPGLYDWDGFINSLNYTPPAPYLPTDCPNQGSCQPGTAGGDLLQRISQYATDMLAGRQNYMATVEIPALNQADEKWLSCINANDACTNLCQWQYYNHYYQCGYYCCTMDCTISVAGCMISYDSLKISILSQAMSFHLSKVQEYLDKAMADYQASLPSLTNEQANFILCFFNSYNDTSTLINNYNADITKYQKDIQAMNSSIASATASCAAEKISCSGGDPKYTYLTSNAAYIDWVTTGHVTTALEPKYCLTVFCFSYDAVSGNFGFEVGAGLAAKFTRNAFTGETAINLGVGLKMGAGMSSIGGNAWIKLSPNQVGVEAKLNAGPAKVGYFYGAERM
jgi:tetratricopeptide (TPR) repeat protein